MRKSLGLFALMVALFAALVAPAGADRGAATEHNRAADNSAARLCSVQFYDTPGTRICESRIAVIYHSIGTEYFVIGANYAVYHIWPGSGGWKSLGGRASTASQSGVFKIGSHTIAINGTDGKRYCRKWPWTVGWQQC